MLKMFKAKMKMQPKMYSTFKNTKIMNFMKKN